MGDQGMTSATQMIVVCLLGRNMILWQSVAGRTTFAHPLPITAAPNMTANTCPWSYLPNSKDQVSVNHGYYRKILTVPRISCLQSGHLLKAPAHFLHANKWPHGKKATCTSQSKHILHNICRAASLSSGVATPVVFAMNSAVLVASILSV